MSNSYLVLYRPGPNWIPDLALSDQPLADHLQYMVNLKADGVVRMGGPFEDSSGGFGIVDVVSMDEVQELVDWDPGIRAGVLTADIVQWRETP